jgi:hypothetical protein
MSAPYMKKRPNDGLRNYIDAKTPCFIEEAKPWFGVLMLRRNILDEPSSINTIYNRNFGF